MQIREQEELNRQRRIQDESAVQRRQELEQKRRSLYDYVPSHGYAGSTNEKQNRASHDDDAEISVYVRECDDAARQSYTFRESSKSNMTSLPAVSSSRMQQASSVAPLRKRSVPSKESSVDAPNRGRVPRYLQQRKAELAAEKGAIAALAERQREMAKIPPGHRLVREEEKADVIQTLDQRERELLNQLSKIPIRFDTQSIVQRRRGIEDELRELEEKRAKYGTKNPLYVPL